MNLLDRDTRRTLSLPEVLLLVLVVLGFVSCATAPAPEVPVEESSLTSRPLYYGEGYGTTLDDARQEALTGAVRKSAEALLGPSAALKYREALDSLISPSFAPKYTREAAVEILESAPEDGRFRVVLRVPIELQVLADELAARSIYGGQVQDGTSAVSLVDEARPLYLAADAEEPPVGETTSALDAEPVPEKEARPDLRDLDLSAIEMSRLEGLLEGLTFMLYHDLESEQNTRRLQPAIEAGNRLLARLGYLTISLRQIETVLTEELETYQDETGGEVGLLRWVAGKLNADILLAIDTEVAGEGASRQSRVTQVGLSAFDVTHGDLLLRDTSARGLETEAVTTEEAVVGAISGLLTELAPAAVREFRDGLLAGIGYELILQNALDDGAVRRFINLLKEELVRISRRSGGPEEFRYELRFLGNVEELEYLIYDTAEAVPGLAGLTLVYQRGNRLTFDAGFEPGR